MGVGRRQGLLDTTVPAQGGVTSAFTKMLVLLTASPPPLDPCPWVGKRELMVKALHPVVLATYHPTPGPPFSASGQATFSSSQHST